MIDFSDKFEKELYDKITTGVELSESELYDFMEFEIDEIKGEDRRWSRTVKTISEIGDKFFLLEWEQGLTENQENEFYNQPYEVEMEEEVILKTVRHWNKV